MLPSQPNQIEKILSIYKPRNDAARSASNPWIVNKTLCKLSKFVWQAALTSLLFTVGITHHVAWKRSLTPQHGTLWFTRTGPPPIASYKRRKFNAEQPWITQRRVPRQLGAECNFTAFLDWSVIYDLIWCLLFFFRFSNEMKARTKGKKG